MKRVRGVLGRFLRGRRDVAAEDVADPDGLKILIVSTPKTGNTWLKHLLSTIYDLPIVDLALSPNELPKHRYGSRWIAHQHYYASQEVIAWARRHQVVLLTTVRHPGDVLLSLYHHVKNDPTSKNYGVEVMLIEPDEQKVPERLYLFVRGFFYVVLNISLTWMRSGVSQVVRYEDLWRDPVATLLRVATQIAPVSRDQVERAVEQCDIAMLRRMARSAKSFFRQGSVGNWRYEVPAETLALFREYEPYPTQFAAYGYTLDPGDPLIAAPVVPRVRRNPFYEVGCFRNGVAVSPMVVHYYLSFASDEAARRWPDVVDVDAADSFYAWMNGPADEDGGRGEDDPVVTRLIAYVHHVYWYRSRKPSDVFGRDRIAWVMWVLQNAGVSFELDAAFLQSLWRWAAAPAFEDSLRAAGLPCVPRMLVRLYGERVDVQKVYPDLFGRDRVGFLIWFLRYGAQEYALDAALVAYLCEPFLLWANEPDGEDPCRGETGLVVTRLAAYVYQQRPAIQRRFPDLYGRDRVDYLAWFVDHHAGGAGLVRAVVASWAQSCLEQQGGLGSGGDGGVVGGL